MIAPDERALSFLGFRPTGDLADLTCYTSKRRKVVWFLKAPPTKPPTIHQQSQRNAFRMVALAWQGMTEAQRQQWSLAEKRGCLSITAYNLFTWWCLRADANPIRTIERQTNTTLI